MSVFLTKARACWAPDCPEWVEELARLVDQSSQGAAAKRIGVKGGSTISEVLANKYKGDVDRIEQLVRGALMGVEVVCPVLGEIGRDQCLGWQAAPVVPSNAKRMQVHRACRSGCPHSRIPARTNQKDHTP